MTAAMVAFRAQLLAALVAPTASSYFTVLPDTWHVSPPRLALRARARPPSCSESPLPQVEDISGDGGCLMRRA